MLPPSSQMTDTTQLTQVELILIIVYWFTNWARVDQVLNLTPTATELALINHPTFVCVPPTVGKLLII